ncbi:class I SAM-dependent DNA methyltransferase [Microcystis aeruginosa]|uniref:class I SAM-dependent DNA methyltransferase n=1 Tax=Microcystis aeruginosa TaxID=1126 RepID=UPI0004B26644|nr:class I SAM-dependent methyltransferase [Microcystis aeruginosa]MDB9396252.1 class I SAM-dependent methyltransferase [Microcystis aeruginosa CS-573]
MTSFGQSVSYYYDLVVGHQGYNKDYVKEVEFIHDVIQNYTTEAQSILDLGCGTGYHAALLAKKGYSVHGVDLSAEMLEQAKTRVENQTMASCLSFSQGNVCTIRLDRQFDVVLALFHVVNYQVTNQDLLATFATVKNHLKAGGIFICDVSYGPYVLGEFKSRPTASILRLEDNSNGNEVTHISELNFLTHENIVEVTHNLWVTNQENQLLENSRETHPQRYLFKPEVELLADACELTVLDAMPWL